ncbi:MAG: SDR family oxidoreductase [Rhodospirillaceae bacterium]|nr:SDR family oxidoreductase [Rhodospirillaceae bacterium]
MAESVPKTALVTGAATRIGRAIALDLAVAGWSVAVHYRRSEKEALAVVDEIRRQGGNAAPVRADLSVESETAALLPLVHRTLGPVGCLVNNASEFERDEILDMTRASWDTHMETNLRAPAFLMQEMARRLPENHHGAIVNVLDQRVWNVTPHFVSYTLSKAGLWVLTQTMALALAPRLRVNAVGPGPVLPSKRQTQEDFDRQVAMLPLQRSSGPGDIAAAVRFILAMSSMTGQMIALDGGQHLGWAQPAGTTETVE